MAAEKALLLEAGCASVFSDECRGAYPFRPQLSQAIASLSSGDCLVVVSLERISWRFEDLALAVAALGQRGVSLVALAEGLDTRSGPDAFAVFRSAASYFDCVRECRAAEAMRANSRQKGNAGDVALMRERVAKGELTASEAARRLGFHRSTFYRRAAAGAHG